MNQKLLASIDIFASDIVATSYTDQGKALRRRMVDVDDIVKMLSGKGSTVKWMTYDKGVVAVGVDTNGRCRYLVHRPPEKTVIKCLIGEEISKFTIWMPSLLAELTRGKRGGWANKMKIFAFRGELNAQTQLHLPPVPNISTNGRLCMGSVPMSSYKDLPANEVLENIFIKANSTDHDTKSMLDDKKYRNILDAIKQTKGKVPMKSLRKVGTYGEVYPR